MAEFRGSTFVGGRVELDGNAFVECRFEGSTLVFFGTGVVTLRECNFNGVHFSLEGPAANTLHFLRGLYNGVGPTGQQLVEQLINNVIRTPFPPDTTRPTATVVSAGVTSQSG